MKKFYLIFLYKTKKHLYYAGIHNGLPKTVPNFKDALLYSSVESLERSLSRYKFHSTKPLLNNRSEICAIELDGL